MRILDQFRKGLPIQEELVIDNHMHIGNVATWHTPSGKAETLIEKMDRIGVDYGCISHMTALHYDAAAGNDEVINAVKDFTPRFIGYAVINPNFPDVVIEELDRCFASGCFRGIKIHPAVHQYPIDGPAYMEVYNYAALHNYPVLIHTWGEQDIAVFDCLAQRYPNTQFILGHHGGEFPAVMNAIYLADKLSNIYLDTACSWMYAGVIRLMVDIAGSHKVLFGSDAVANSIEAALGRIAYSDVSESDKRYMLGLNIKGLLKL